MRALIERLRIRPEDALLDFTPWSRLLRAQLLVFLIHFLAFAGMWWWLSENVHSQGFSTHFHQTLSHFFVIVLAAQVVVVVVFNWNLFKGALAAFLYQKTSPYNLALMRIVAMGILTGHVMVYVPAHLSQVAALPPSARVSLPGIGWLIDLLPINPLLFQMVTLLCGVACFLAMLGLFTRWSLLASAILLLYVLGVPNFFGKVNHTHFMVWLPAFLAFAPAGEVWSLDGWIRKRPSERTPHFRYGLAMKLIFLQIGLIYFFSAVGKLWLGGFDWILTDNLVYMMRLEWLENYGLVPAIRMDHYPWLTRFAAFAVVLFELAYVFLLLLPRTRVPAAVSAIFFHNLTAYFLYIDFVFLQILGAFHLDWNTWLRRLTGRRPIGLAVLLAVVAGGLLAVWNPLFGVVIFLLGAYLIVRRGRKSRNNAPEVELSRSISPWMWRMGGGILFFNILFGMAQVTSWPFTAYPSYSYVRQGTVEYLWFRPVDPEGQPLDLDALGQEANYRKENILAMAERAVWQLKWGTEAEFEARLINYWLRYREKVPALKVSQDTEVVFQVLSTDPDRADPVVEETSLGRLRGQGKAWKWVPHTF